MDRNYEWKAGMMRRKIVVLIIFGLTSICSAQFGGGNGTEDNPYTISRTEHLNNIREEFLSAHYIQMADIDLGVAPFIEGEGWIPLAPPTNPFTGTYNGNGYTISNLTTNRVSNENSLFGRTVGAIIENVHLRDVEITDSKADTGALVGHISGNTEIRNCSSTGEISISGRTDRHIGGLIGNAVNSTITDCYSSVNITNGERTGGLVGWLNGAHVRTSYATGNLIDVGTVSGGLVGLIQRWGPGVGDGTVTNCFARGFVRGTTELGGLIGTTTVAGELVVNSYSTGRITGTGGGFIGRPYQTGVTTNCYWDTETSEKEESGCGAEGRLTRQMTYPYDLNETYLRWDFEEIWREDRDFVPGENPGINNGYPYLFIQGGGHVFVDIPEVTIELVEYQGVNNVKLTWEAVEDANSYKVYVADNPHLEDWGEPVTIAAETQYYHPVGENKRKFYKVVASVSAAP